MRSKERILSELPAHRGNEETEVMRAILEVLVDIRDNLSDPTLTDEAL